MAKPIRDRQRSQQSVQSITVGAIHMPAVTSFGMASTTVTHTISLQFDASYQTNSSGARVTSGYQWFLAGDITGLTAPAAAVAGSSNGSLGRVINNSTATFGGGIVLTNSTGAAEIVLSSTGTSTYFLGVILGNGRFSMSTAFFRST